MTRQCGACELCCKLLPMKAGKKETPKTLDAMVEHGIMTLAESLNMTPDFDKPAGQRCPHQRHHKGCTIYARRPFGCRTWSCRWLTGHDTEDLHRPDHTHYVVDISPDFVKVDLTGGNNADTVVPVVQVWLDPDYPDAHRDPALRAFLVRRAEQEGMAALIRLNNRVAFFLAAPSMSQTGDWFEKHSATIEKEHTVTEKLAAIGPMTITIER